jgi:hypothetical protein
VELRHASGAELSFELERAPGRVGEQVVLGMRQEGLVLLPA